MYIYETSMAHTFVGEIQLNIWILQSHRILSGHL